MIGVVSWKSTQENVVSMFTGLDCSSSAPAEFPLTAYTAAIQLPVDSPLM